MKYLNCIVVLVLMMAGCKKANEATIPDELQHLGNVSVYRGSTEPANEIEIREDIEFGNRDEVIIGDFTSVAIGHGGNVFIADREQDNIKIFGREGGYITSLGREGNGPAEFNSISDIFISENTLFVYDSSQHRMVVFSIDSLNHKYTFNVASNRNEYPGLKDGNISGLTKRNDGTFLVSFLKHTFPDGRITWGRAVHTDYYYLMDRQGQIISDQILALKSAVNVFIPAGGITVERPTGGLFARSQFVVGPGNFVYTSWPDHFLIKVYRPAGTYERGIYYANERVPLTGPSAVEAGIPELVTDNFSKIPTPDYWPAFDDLLVDEKNRLWASTIVPDLRKREWRLLDGQGKLLAAFRWPAAIEIELIKNNDIYALEENPQTGLQTLSRYHFELK